MADFYTRETWRAGKKRRMRKRVKPYGGQKVAPPAFLEAAKRTYFAKGRANHRICHATKKDGTPCRMLALSGLKVCGVHGGYSTLARQGKFLLSGRAAAFKAERAKAIEDRFPHSPPLDLIRLPIYVQSNQWTRARLIRAWGTPAWFALIRQIRESPVTS